MEKNQAAVALGKLGGSVSSKRKAAAARKNAKLGGWPKGRKRGKRRPETDANVIAHRVVSEAVKLTQQ
jgi:hypothetical protein